MSILFEETEIRGLTLKNRFVRSATWEVAADEEGRPGRELTEMIEGLARGGVGLIVVGHAFVRPDGLGSPRQTGIHRDELVELLSEIPRRTRPYGSRVALQISHSGGHADPAWGREELVAPSPYRNLYGGSARELTLSEIGELVDAFVQAGRRARAAGFEAVQIHAAHGYLVNQFLSPVWNKRTDRYGGTLENRSRFLLEICSGVRSVLGEGFPLLVKLTSQDYIEGGFTLEESVQVARRLQEVGVDAVEVSGGSRYSGSLSHIRSHIRKKTDEAWFSESARRMKQELDVPVILVGGIRSLDVAEEIVTGGCCDYVALSRPLICEPGLVNRWSSGDRSPAQCTSDNLCFGPAYEGRGLWCETRRLREEAKGRKKG